MRHHVARRGGLVISHIVDRAGTRFRDRGFEHARDVVHMDAAEHLAVFVDAPCGAGLELVEHAAPRPVNAGKAEHLHRHADLLTEVEPVLLGHNARFGPRTVGLRDRLLADPVPLLVAIDAHG